MTKFPALSRFIGLCIGTVAGQEHLIQWRAACGGEPFVEGIYVFPLAVTSDLS